MVITLSPEIEAALIESAKRHGVSPEALALSALRERFASRPALLEPQDAWERRLFGAARNYGVGLSNEAVSSEGLYD
jgi:hypothetical protein